MERVGAAQSDLGWILLLGPMLAGTLSGLQASGLPDQHQTFVLSEIREVLRVQRREG